MGPLGVIVGLGELWVTAWLVSRLNPALTGIVTEVVEPFVTVGLLLLGTCLAAAYAFREGLWAQALLGGVLFSGLFLLRERLPGRVPLVSELRTIVGLVRARRRGVAPEGAAP